MAISKIDNFAIPKNISNLMLITNYEFLGMDKTYYTLNTATSPWTITIKAGSMIEYMGGFYMVENNDISIQLPNNITCVILGFNGSSFLPLPAYCGYDYDSTKYGIYYMGYRIIKLYIDIANGTVEQFPSEIKRVPISAISATLPFPYRSMSTNHAVSTTADISAICDQSHFSVATFNAWYWGTFEYHRHNSLPPYEITTSYAYLYSDMASTLPPFSTVITKATYPTITITATFIDSLTGHTAAEFEQLSGGGLVRVS
jgi:hypothetical protein